MIEFTAAIPEFKEWLQTRKLSDETVRGYCIDVRQFYEWRASRWNAPVDAGRLELVDFDGYVNYLLHDRACQPNSVNRKLNSLSTFFECLIQKEYRTTNPMLRVHRLKVVEQERIYLSAEEVERILSAVEHPVIHYFLKMMAFTGMRVSECRNLQMSHVDFESLAITIINGKGGKSRRIPLNEELKKELLYYIQNVRDAENSTHFFALKRTGKVSPQYVNKILREAAKRIGIHKHVTSHILRHSFASYLIKKGTHVAVIQKLLGHANLRTTSTYLHVDDTELVVALERLYDD